MTCHFALRRKEVNLELLRDKALDQELERIDRLIGRLEAERQELFQPEEDLCQKDRRRLSRSAKTIENSS